MKKKRLIFSLLYDRGKFCVSRNFRLQAVGDFDWLLKNCRFDKMLFALDEVCIINCSRGSNAYEEDFQRCLKRLNRLSYAPVTVGGWIRCMEDAEAAFSCGADKLMLNTSFFEKPDLIQNLRARYGRQAIVASIDIDQSGVCWTRQGTISTRLGMIECIDLVERLGSGEILVNSIARDGTGNGLDLRSIKIAMGVATVPVIFTGGVGKPEHLVEGYLEGNAMSIATSNLLNFVGDSILRTREILYRNGVDLPIWENPS